MKVRKKISSVLSLALILSLFTFLSHAAPKELVAANASTNLAYSAYQAYHSLGNNFAKSSSYSNATRVPANAFKGTRSFTDGNMWATHSSEHNNTASSSANKTHSGLAINLQGVQSIGSLYIVGSQPGTVSQITLQYSNSAADWSNLSAGGTAKGNWTLSAGAWQTLGTTYVRGRDYPSSGNFTLEANLPSSISAQYLRIIFTYDSFHSSMVKIASFEAYGSSYNNTAPQINYNIWQLQLPNNTQISPANLAGYASAYFYRNGNTQTFMCPQYGTPTSGSKHPRSEMREMNPWGGGAAWSFYGTNTLSCDLSVAQVGGGAGGRTAIGQVFCSSGGFPLCEIMYTANPNSKGGNITILYEEAKSAGQYTYLPVVIPVNTRFSYKASLSNGVLNIYINGNNVFSRTPSLSGQSYYFKFGNYDQTAVAGTLTTAPYSVVNFYAAEVVHN